MFSKELKIDLSSNGLKKLDKSLSAGASQAARKSADILEFVQDAYPVYKNNVSSIANNTAAHLKSFFENTGKKVGSGFDTVGIQLRSTERSLLKIGLVYAVYKIFAADNENVVKATQKVKKHVKEKPVQSAAIALGAGYLLGKIFR